MASGNPFAPPRVDLGWIAHLADPLIEAAQNAQTAKLLQQYAAGQLNQTPEPSRAQQLLSVGEPAAQPGLVGLGPAAPPAPKVPTFAAIQGNQPSGKIAGLIASAAQQYGQDPATLTRIAQIESSLDPNAKNPNSSAGGLFQFIDSTARQYGLSNKFDPAASADAGARLARDNANGLRNALGRDPTPGEIYLAHQQGLGGAIKLLSNPNARAADLVGAEAVRLNGGNPGMTAAQFASLWDRKMGLPGGSAPRGVAMTMPALPQQVAAAPNVGYLPRRDPNFAPVAPNWQTAQATPQQFAAQLQTARAGTAGPAAPAVAETEADVQRLEQQPGFMSGTGFVPPRPSAPALPPAPAPAPLVAPLSASSAPAPAPAAAAPRPAVSPQQQAILMQMLANPQTRGLAMQQIQQLSASPYSFQVVGENLVRTNARQGTAEVVPGLNKPTSWQHFQTQDGRQVAFNPVTLDTRVLDAGGGGWRPMTPQERTAYQIPDNTGAAMGPGGKPTPLAGTSSVNIDQKGETAFATTANTGIAKRLQSISEEGDTARSDLATLGQIRALGGAIDQNTLPALRARLAEYGFKVGDDLGQIQAFEALVDKMVPSQRVPGAGSTSDFDAKTFKSALPRLMNTPEGNALIVGTLEALAQDKLARAAIAEQALAGEIKPQDAIRQLRALPNPDLAFKSGLNELGKAGKLSAPAPQARSGPPSAQNPPARINTKAEFDALPSGRTFVAPDGSVRVKP